MSSAQSGMWLAQEFAHAGLDYSIAEYVEIIGTLEVAAFRRAAQIAYRDTDAGHVRMIDDGDGPVQVLSDDPLVLPYVDLSGEPDPVEAADDWMANQLATVIDPARGRLYATALLRVAERVHRWYLRCHHVIFDGFSAALFVGRVAAEYTALTTGGAEPRGFGRLTDLLARDETYRTSQERERDRDHWADALRDAPPPVSFGTAGAHTRQGHAGRIRTTEQLGPELVARLEHVAKSCGTPVPAVVAGAVAAYVARLTGEREALLGFPVTARFGAAAKRIPGMVSNVVPLRVAADPAQPLGEFLPGVAAAMRTALRHQRYPYEELRRDLRLSEQGQPLVGPHVNVMLTGTGPRLGDCVATRHNLTNGPVEDLAVVVYDGVAGGWRLDIDANDERYDRGDLETHRHGLCHVLDGIAAGGPASVVGDLDVLSAGERDLVRTGASGPPVPGHDVTVTALLDAQVARTPERTAVVAGDERLTYAELDRRACRLARLLAARGIGPESVVAVALPRSADLMVTLLAILKAGAAYLPIDPDLPPGRVARLLADARPALVVTPADTAAEVPVLALADPDVVRALDAVPDTAFGDAERTQPLRPGHPVYVIYTSGSTGAPKGVVNTHAAVANRLLWAQDRHRLSGVDRVLQKTSCGFDVSAWEFFWPLIAGAELVLAQPGGHKDPAYLASVIAAHRVTTVHFVPSMLKVFLAEPGARECTSLRRVICSGETLSADLARQFFATLDCELHNLYGPTEAAIDVTAWRCAPDEAGAPPIGRPISNVGVHVLNKALQPVPAGVPGELYLTGAGLARGYLGRAALTAERFVACPFGPPGTRMYRTGDLARWSRDRRLHYLGREDDQVKIRGVRVEPEEIAVVLRGHPEVAAAEVVARADHAGNRQLVGYVVPDRAAIRDVDGTRVRQWEELYQHLYTTAPDRPLGEDFAGWQSSYDGRPIPLDEMRAWRDGAVARIAALRPRRVLEIGVGSGLILSRLVDDVASYWATDLSAAAVETLRARLGERSADVELFARPADDFTGLPWDYFDVVVLNSVVQYFPSSEYLTRVLDGALGALAPGGAVFVGDVRDLRLLRTFETGVRLAAGSDTDAAAVRRAVEHRALQENELLLDPAFFTAFAAGHDAGADIRVKDGHYDNELSRYRYDVTLHKGGAESLAGLPEREWDPAWRADDIAALATKPVRLTGVPNRRIAAESAAARALFAGRPLPEVRAALAAAHEGPDRSVFAELGARTGLDVIVTWSEAEDTLDVLFVPPGDRPRTGVYRPRGTGRLASDPLVAARIGTLGTALRGHARERLPEYLVPAAVVVVGELPVTPNGKLDRAALPEPEFGTHTSGRASATARERLLCDLFAEVLGLPSVGPDDSFFDLGGDSISAIQLTSRARRAGLSFSPADVFANRTVARLATVVTTPRPLATLDPVGPLPATPIMRELLDLDDLDPEFSQSVTLVAPAGLDEAALVAAVRAVLTAHDALRIRWRAGELTVAGPEGVTAADHVERVRTEAADDAAAEYATASAARLSPADGHLLRVVWLDAGPGRPGRLVLTAHHLAVDGVSWRILVPDLVRAYRVAAAGGTPVLTRPHTSYREWAHRLADQAAARAPERPLWTDVLRAGGPALAPRALDPAVDTVATQRTLIATLPADLLDRAAAAFHCGIDTVLLNLLARAVVGWRGAGPVLVDVERHGRDDDVASTVGWFTTLFPVRLDGCPGTPGATLKAVKEHLATIPAGGSGFGLLRHLDPAAALAGFRRPELAFNYLGRLTNGTADWAPVAGGLSWHAGAHRPLAHAIEVNAAVRPCADGAELATHWSWAGALLSEEDIHALVGGWEAAARALADHLDEPGAGGHTPSDVPLVSVTQDELDRIEAAYPGLEDVLPLTPLQSGLLYHSEYDRGLPDPYHVQVAVTVEGALDLARLRAAAAALVDRHPSLRASVLRRENGDAVQLVQSTVDVEVTVGAPPDEAGDMVRRFDRGAAPLLRITVIELGADRWRIVLTNHHLVLDGWSMPVVLRELFALYTGATLPPAPDPATYYAWLAEQDTDAARAAWRAELTGVSEPTLIADADPGTPVPPEEHVLRLDEDLTAALTERARRLETTVSTLFLVAWGVLLSRLTGRQDVVFGTTVAGRPPGLPGIETMVGTFVNTVPVRVRAGDDEPLRALVTRLGATRARLGDHEFLGLAEIQRLAGTGGPLFDTLVVFENYPVDGRDLDGAAGLRVTDVHTRDTVQYPLSLVVFPGERLTLRVGYRPDAVAAAEARAYAAALVRLLTTLAAAPDDLPAGALDVLGAAEREAVLAA
ncbi:MAG: amino acid adenylation domain-containing protein, partial [Actinophytocola sp.]|uniref:amino acid adenylation domain-containing protein n=1 Tax=Actinophytocola sp. TaxID=1872138 RepID=UPI003C75F9FC